MKFVSESQSYLLGKFDGTGQAFSLVKDERDKLHVVSFKPDKIVSF